MSDSTFSSMPQPGQEQPGVAIFPILLVNSLVEYAAYLLGRFTIVVTLLIMIYITYALENPPSPLFQRGSKTLTAIFAMPLAQIIAARDTDLPL